MKDKLSWGLNMHSFKRNSIKPIPIGVVCASRVLDYEVGRRQTVYEHVCTCEDIRQSALGYETHTAQ